MKSKTKKSLMNKDTSYLPKIRKNTKTNYLPFNQTNKNISKLVLKNKSFLFNKSELDFIPAIFPITFRTFNTKNPIDKQLFAIDSLFRRIKVNKELEKNKKRILVICYLLKGKELRLEKEIKDYIKSTYYFPYVFDEIDIS